MSLEEHIDYLGDARRTQLFSAAIAGAVRPGDTVADLGCGSGILGLICLNNGAGKVFFIDRGPILEVARETVARAGFTGKASFLLGKTHQVSLPQRVDLLVCDHVGYFGFDYGIFQLLKDARERFLKPGGRIMPARMEMKFAPFQSAAVWDRIARWQSKGVPREFHWAHHLAANCKHSANLQSADLLASPAELAAVDFLHDLPDVITEAAEFRASRSGYLHGIAGFFKCELADGIFMTNEPGASGAIDRPQAILPLPEPVAVAEGDAIIVSVVSRPFDDLIAWDVTLPMRRKVKMCTFNGQILGLDDLRRLAPSHRPLPSPAAAARALVLSYCDGRRTNAQIAAAVLKEHPNLMPSAEEIESLVTKVLRTDTQ